jgi:hypothetical protein
MIYPPEIKQEPEKPAEDDDWVELKPGTEDSVQETQETKGVWGYVASFWSKKP